MRNPYVRGVSSHQLAYELLSREDEEMRGFIASKFLLSWFAGPYEPDTIDTEELLG